MFPFIERHGADAGGLQPEAEAALASIDPNRFHHLEHGFRPPVGVYRTSLAQVWPSLLAVLDELQTVERDRPFVEPALGNWEAELLKRQEHLLYCVFEHVEDCDSVLKCCFPPGEPVGKNQHVKEYRRQIAKYRDRLGRVVNRIKHNQGRLRYVVFYGDSWCAPGYFVEAVDASGGVGPDPLIHAGGNTAFSFARDLRNHFVAIFLVSHFLSRAVTALAGQGSIVAIPDSRVDDVVASVAKRLHHSNAIVFPDELEQEFPSIHVEQGERGTRIRVFLLPSGSGPIQIPEFFRLTVGFRGDGVTRAFAFPYMSPEQGRGV
jgi:hypothetical protein